MYRMQNASRASRLLASLALLLPLSAPAKTPVPLSPVPETVPTRVETSGEQRVIHFGDRQYRLSPPRADNKGVVRQPLAGSITHYDSLSGSGSWRSGTFDRYAGPAGFQHVWLLPGFGLAVGSSRERGGYFLYLLRGSDGTLNPPVPGVYAAGLEPLVVRAGATDADLLAGRTLLLFGSHASYEYSGIRIKDKKATPVNPVSAAWLFDTQGVVQQWSPLRSLTPLYSDTDAHTDKTERYFRRGPAGEVMFATAGAGDTLDVHVLSADLKPLRTVRGVREYLQQTEQPVDRSKAPGAYGYWHSHFVELAQIGAYAMEKSDVWPAFMKSVLLAPMPGVDGWYGVLQADGSLAVPGDGIGLKPLVRKRKAPVATPGMRAVDYDLAYGYLVAWRVKGDIRYGWASPELSTNTGPVWRNALLVESELLAERRSLNVDPRLLLVQLDTGAWQAIAEPKVHVEESTFVAPNTFSGFLPPASTPQQAGQLAEAVVIALAESINKRNAAVQGSTLAHMRQQTQAYEQQRRAERARREEVWRMAIQGLVQGVGQAQVTPSRPGREASHLGPDYYWEGGQLIHGPTQTTVVK